LIRGSLNKGTGKAHGGGKKQRVVETPRGGMIFWTLDGSSRGEGLAIVA